jgi:hypothetical protein
MRSTSLALRIAFIVGLSLMAGNSAYAQGYTNTGGNNNNGAQSFGTTTCRQKVPCPQGTAYFSASDYAAGGNACMVEGFGMGTQSGYFDESSGLDGNGCLTVRSELLVKKDSKLIMPHCCVTTLPDNSCAFHCDLTNGW